MIQIKSVYSKRLSPVAYGILSRQNLCAAYFIDFTENVLQFYGQFFASN